MSEDSDEDSQEAPRAETEPLLDGQTIFNSDGSDRENDDKESHLRLRNDEE